MKTFLPFLLIASLFFTLACNNSDTTNTEATSPTSAKSSVANISYSVVNSYPHDTSSFTEGLLIYNNQLFESTGNYGHSKLLQEDLKTGKAIRQLPLEDKFFGEGITILHDTLYQLTWKEHVVFVYSLKDFKKIKEFTLNTEGWSLTNDGTNLIVSDGSSNLFFYEPSTFRLLRTQGVTEDGTPAININELEYINGYVYANQWQYNDILKIDPSSGQVVGRLDLTELVNRVKSKDPQADVLNGIAYDAATKKVYVTGKYWPELYEIAFSY